MKFTPQMAFYFCVICVKSQYDFVAFISNGTAVFLVFKLKSTHVGLCSRMQFHLKCIYEKVCLSSLEDIRSHQKKENGEF